MARAYFVALFVFLVWWNIVPEMPKKNDKKAKIPQTVKVRPFLDVSSFEVEPILSDKSHSSIYLDVENTHCNQIANPNNASVSNWAVTNQHEITAPWLTELSPERKVNSGRHISIGTLIGAQSENLGSLSGDSERDRPYFGKLVSTPPKVDPSSYRDQFANGPSTDVTPEDSSMKKFRMSSLSELLDEISTTDPAQFATKIVEKYNPSLQKIPTKYTSNHDGLTEKSAFQHSTELNKNTIVLSDIEESKGTLIRSASSSNVSEQTDDHGECKSTTSEPVQSIDNSLNCSVGSSERGSIKTTKSDTCSKCSMPSTHNVPQELSRPTSSCSTACNMPLLLDNALSLQYGSLRYFNSCTATNQNCFHNFNLLQQVENSGLPCPHICGHHALQPNLLSNGASNSYQSVLPNALSAPLLLTGPPCFKIETPSEICFPEKIALGDSQEMNLTIWNSGSVGCYYKITCTSAYLNYSPLPFEMSGLNCNKAVPSSTGNTTDIKLVLAPKYEGKIEVNLQIDAFINYLGLILNTAPVSTARTKIQYDVLRPSIAMLSKGKDTLNIGHVVAGSTFVEYITVTNNCEVSVPLRISLSNDSRENQIYFGLKEMDRHKHPTSGGLRFLSPKVLLYRLPATKDKSLPSSLDIPIVFESINGRVDSTVTAAIETPTLSEILAFMKITATGGNAKLVLKDPNQNPLLLKAFKGATCNHSVTVINVGRLAVVYDIHIDGDSDGLSVSPSSLNLQPNQCATLSVVFTPSTYHNVKGNLLAAAEPHGQVFPITEIIGQVKAHSVKSQLNIPEMPPTRPTRDSSDFALESSNLIECNRKYLTWGGVDIGKESGVKTCTIRNPKQDPVQIKLFIKSKFQDFLLIDDAGNKTSVYEVTLKAKEEKLVSVVFIPISVTSYSSLLCIKPVSENDRVFSISLSGYGGTSNLKVLDLPDSEGAGYHLNVDESHETDKVYKNIIFHNVGCRPAFVKLLITYDGLVQNVVEKQTVIHPSEFVLLEKEKKSILVSINCVNRNLSSNEVILIFTGDEIMRQKLRKYWKTNPSSSENQERRSDINFNVPYDGEDKVVYDLLLKSFPDEKFIFYNNLKRLVIEIKRENTSLSSSFGSLSEVQASSVLTLNSTAQFRHLTIEGHSPPVKESTCDMHRLSLPLPFNEPPSAKPVSPTSSVSIISDYLRNVKLDSWTVQPEELTIDADIKDKGILLKSHFDSDLRFKVKWTIDVIKVSPLSGILPANGEIGLRLTLINTNHCKLIEDYHGNVRILCDSIEKIVNVKVCKDDKLRGASPVSPVLNDSQTSDFSENTIHIDTELKEISSYMNIESIFDFPEKIKFRTTKCGVLSETVLIVSNPLKKLINWSFIPASTLYIEPHSNYINFSIPTFEFCGESRSLKNAESLNISVRFRPQVRGSFLQKFTLILSTNKKEETRIITVQGKAFKSYTSFFDYNCQKIREQMQASTKKK